MANWDQQHNPCFQIVPTARDGHCLLYAVIISWIMQLPNVPPPTLHDLKCGIFLESLNNRHIYREFLHDVASNKEYAVCISKYLLHKHYDSTFGDLVPVIIANALSVNVNIRNKNDDGDINDILIHPRDGAKERTILLQRANDHFSGVNILERL